MTKVVLDMDSVKAETWSGGEALVLHCHFYNCALQEAVENAWGDDAVALQVQAAQHAVRQQLAVLGAELDAPTMLELGSRVFSEFGFGVLDMGSLTPRGGLVTVLHSHYAMGWLATRGERKTPACAFVAGFIGGALSAAFRVPGERVLVRELTCLACGAESCTFRAEVL